MIRFACVLVPVPLKTQFTYSFNDQEMDVRPGMRVQVLFHNRKERAYVIKVEDKRPDGDFTVLPILKIIDKEPIFTDKEVNLALWMEKFYFSSRGIILDTMIPGGKRDVSIPALDCDASFYRPDIELTEDQKNAVETVLSSDKKMFYLYGITGSGKTEVFLNCAERIIKDGGQVIYLVPEITLTHQLAQQVLKRFENNVAILHSGLTDSQRITQWRKIRRGEVNLVIGARSAVFAPCEKLKLIIIDEEHENSYKSSNDPRYHARQVAQKRITDCKGKLLMGSATPSLESWYLMKDPDKMVRLDLKQRVGGGSLPAVEIADMKGVKSMFSPLLIERIYSVLGKGRQVILFLNRRGFSYYFHCRTCGYEHKCPHCDVAMTYHRQTNSLVCHYCGYKTKPVKVCPECGSLDVMYSGYGTEQVEEEVKRVFPQYSVARLDTDVVSSDRKIIQKTLDDFGQKKTDILLGTQMVAKGLNFPNVQLVGIVMADNGLLVPDFRAEERTFDLLVQVGGRSGRKSNDGLVVVQTRMKDNDAISYATRMDVSSFLDRELEIRRQTGFPPFSRMINIVVRSKNKKAAYDFADKIAVDLRNIGGDFEVFGAQECPVEKIREAFRYQVLLRSVNPIQMFNALTKVLAVNKTPYLVNVEVDVDPLELL